MNLLFLRNYVLLCLVFLFQVNISKASHAAGAEFSYEYISPNTYELTYTFYRDCHGIQTSSSIDVQILNGCGFASQTVYLSHNGFGTALQTTCQNVLTECNGGLFSGREKYIYRGIITLAGPCHDWLIGHLELARNSAISTVQGINSDNLYVFCTINNSPGILNNSPVFISDPVVIYDVNQRISIDNSVSDTENDFIVFEMIVPRSGPNLFDTISYLPGYTFDHPFISSIPVTLDPNTGTIEGLPVQTDGTIYALLISEYRNGILIGQTERDLNFQIELTGNIIPELSPILGSLSYTIDVFANQNNCFQIATSDSNVTNTTTIQINSAISGMNYFISGIENDTGNFCWNPSLADTILNPHCFTVSVRDDNCPYPGYQARTYCLNVQLPTSTDDLKSNDFSIYPNPFNSKLTIKLDHSGKSELTIFDMQGRKIVSKILDSSESVHDFQDLESGMYLVSITTLENNQVYYQRMLKVN